MRSKLIKLRERKWSVISQRVALKIGEVMRALLIRNAIAQREVAVRWMDGMSESLVKYSRRMMARTDACLAI